MHTQAEITNTQSASVPMSFMLFQGVKNNKREESKSTCIDTWCTNLFCSTFTSTNLPSDVFLITINCFYSVAWVASSGAETILKGSLLRTSPYSALFSALLFLVSTQQFPNHQNAMQNPGFLKNWHQNCKTTYHGSTCSSVPRCFQIQLNKLFFLWLALSLFYMDSLMLTLQSTLTKYFLPRWTLNCQLHCI